MEHGVLRWKGDSCSPSLPRQGGFLQCPRGAVNPAPLLLRMVTGAHSFPEQRVLWNSLESAQNPIEQKSL